MKILVIHQYYLQPGEGGGSRFNEMSHLWSRDGHEVTVIAGNLQSATGEKLPKYRWKWLTKENDSGVTVWRCHVSQMYRLGALGRAWAFFTFIVSSTFASLIAGKADVVIATSPPLFIAIPGWIAARVRSVPWVFEMRDLLPDGLVTLGILRPDATTTKLMYRIEAWGCRTSAKINVLTPAFREDLVRRGLASEEKISFISNGADDATFRPGCRMNGVRSRYGWGDKFVAMYTGAHGPANDLDRLIEAAERLRKHPNVLLVSVGDGPERERLESDARARALDNLMFCGPQPKAVMPEFINAADAGLATLRDTPTYRTVYPNKVFDYMACARPVVLAIDGVARKLVCVEAAAGVFVPPGDGQALADAILELSREPARCAALGGRGREWVIRNVSRTALARQYAEILTSLVPRMTTSQTTRRRSYLRFGKRLFDVIAAAVALVVLSPLLLALYVASRIWLGSPVIFAQRRAGYLGEPFTLYKFRSMNDERDESGRLLPDHLRLTAYGRFLRSTSLDELPGLWNVVRGDLSLIGPRPLPLAYNGIFNAEQVRRFEVVPGMAGYAALFGRNAQSWESLFEGDVWYLS
jgi:lipopolysaccharide/colanic/teichoic acid biosynthesis glycosyltransferase